MSVFVLWEDRAIGSLASFGPHAFLVACVASRLHIDRHRLNSSEAIRGKSCGGNANVIRELQQRPLWNSVLRVVAVLDTDEIHDRIPGIPSRRTIVDDAYAQWSDAVANDIRKRVPEVGQNQLEICFLDRNLETLLALVGSGMPQLSGALGKKRLDRDRILHRAAADEALVRRACAEMPSWEHLVATVAQLIAGNMNLLVAGLI
jgi:hypothetical protein